jgi:predicted nucleic acid-binding protein
VGLTVLDAGPIIAVLDGADVHHQAAVDALRRLEESGDQLVIPAVTYAECLVHPARRGEPAMAAVDAYLDALPVSIEPVTDAIARRAAGLRAKYGKHLRLPDALVVATALELNVNRILTTDTRWPPLTVDVEVIGG